MVGYIVVKRAHTGLIYRCPVANAIPLKSKYKKEKNGGSPILAIIKAGRTWTASSQNTPSKGTY
jgi:hypothetical protein